MVTEARYYNHEGQPTQDWDSLINDPMYSESSEAFKETQQKTDEKLKLEYSRQTQEIMRLESENHTLKADKKAMVEKINYLLSFISDCLEYQPNNALTHNERHGINKLILERIRLFSPWPSEF